MTVLKVFLEVPFLFFLSSASAEWACTFNSDCSAGYECTFNSDCSEGYACIHHQCNRIGGGERASSNNNFRFGSGFDYDQFKARMAKSKIRGC